MNLPLALSTRVAAPMLQFSRKQVVWLVAALILALIALIDANQAVTSIGFVAEALVGVSPFLLASILIAAYASASGADGLISRAFSGAPLMMILVASIAGGLSPFCSCGVIPLIAALLAMGVPLPAVMAFWLSSPIMDPSMFVLTTAVLGLPFAIGKTIAAVALGMIGGLITKTIEDAGLISNYLKDGIGNGGCGGGKVRNQNPVVWSFWAETERRVKFRSAFVSNTLFLGQWLTVAFLLESLMLAYIPAETVSTVIGQGDVLPVLIATIVGVPAYLNGYAALPVVSALIEQGMTEGAAMAFLVAGGVTSIPAAIAVWALVKLRVFALYIAISLVGSFSFGLLYNLAIS